ncbi:hypothetical protein SSS_04808 [Sarcoptes scabiei]|uniref:Uncharacterized protein n=1 Tax=Sarcoptes scabiei TaxID=52283 RepID=A0A834REE2_SARSC|nr:hypothetical protein SSS_04808 [Sarcoptes scabiei]
MIMVMMIMKTIEMNLIEVIDITSKYYGLNFRNKKSLQLRILLLISYTDFFYSLFVLIRSLNPSNQCYLIEFGCMVLQQNRIHINVCGAFYRGISFFLLNFWYLNDQQWLRMANYQFSQLASAAIEIEFDSLQKWVRKSIYTVLATIIIFDLVTYCIMETENWIDFVAIFILIFYSTYVIGFFFAQVYILNCICVDLFRSLKESILANLDGNSFNYERINNFWSLYLMITYIKIFLKQFYIILILCIAIVILEAYYMTFYVDQELSVQIALIVGITILVLAIIYLSVMFGRIEEETKILSGKLYRYFNIKNFYYWLDYNQINKINNLMKSLDQIVGLEVLGNPINMTTIIKFTTIFFSITTLLFRKTNSKTIFIVTTN